MDFPLMPYFFRLLALSGFLGYDFSYSGIKYNILSAQMCQSWVFGLCGPWIGSPNQNYPPKRGINGYSFREPRHVITDMSIMFFVWSLGHIVGPMGIPETYSQVPGPIRFFAQRLPCLMSFLPVPE